MKIYVVIEDIDDYPECGGGVYHHAVFLNYTNAEKYVKQKHNTKRVTWRVETWETVDEKEN